mmetsp:Transcript_11574/g.26377  ORF Transcript_11574/g.26377 Transcript_11574/m.26377 type:complete len:177 (+) Transcript_11574:1665-2195(+)
MTLGWTGCFLAAAANDAAEILLMPTPTTGADDWAAAGTGAGLLPPPGRTDDRAFITGGAGRAAEPAGARDGGCFARDDGGPGPGPAFTMGRLAACGGGLASCGGGLAAGADIEPSFLPPDGADGAAAGGLLPAATGPTPGRDGATFVLTFLVAGGAGRGAVLAMAGGFPGGCGCCF